jgi:two-component system, sensor histidine kinase and response regulator
MARIAVVEDMPEIQEILSFILEDVYRIDLFSDGQTFIEEFAPGRFALVILDLVMPGLDGYEVYRRIRRQDATVPVVAFTASVFEAEKTKALRSGFCDFLPKPILDMDQFRMKIRECIGNHSRALEAPQPYECAQQLSKTNIEESKPDTQSAA